MRRRNATARRGRAAAGAGARVSPVVGARSDPSHSLTHARVHAPPERCLPCTRVCVPLCMLLLDPPVHTLGFCHRVTRTESEGCHDQAPRATQSAIYTASWVLFARFPRRVGRVADAQTLTEPNSSTYRRQNTGHRSPTAPRHDLGRIECMGADQIRSAMPSTASKFSLLLH